jgi:PhzF family phenazine biosynthesis protein
MTGLYSMTTQIIQVDAFTSEPFGGNPAAVCLPDREVTTTWMQAVAAEMNLSETAFLRRRDTGGFSIRWFTPVVEVPLCGHATLASAHVLWDQELASGNEPITFHAQHAVLVARRESGWISLDFPALPVEACDCPSGLAEALRCRPLKTHRSRSGVRTVLVEAESEEVVRSLRPDFGSLERVDLDACILTAPADSDLCDFVSRFFGPGIGIPEDPVTGAAHCSLGPYWAERLGKTELVGHQISERGGVVKVRVRGDRVDLLGQAVTVSRGELLC